MYEPIIEALRRGDNDQALSAARQAVRDAPESADAQRMLAMALNANGDRGAALEVVEQALANSPDDADLHLQRASMLLGGGELGAAQSAVSKSIESNPNQFAAYVLQGQMALGRGDADEAERIARLAARIEPDHPWLLAIEGMVALARGEHNLAIRILSQAAEASPDDAQVLLALALSHAAAGHHAFAEQALRNLIEKNGEHPGWRMLLVQSVLRQKRPGDAFAELEPLLDESDPVEAGTLRLAGEVQLAAGRVEEALQWLRRALRKSPTDPRALALSMQAWQGLGDTEGARATLDEVLAASPGTSALWKARAALEADPAQALDIVARWNQALPGQVEPMEAQMRLLRRVGNPGESLSVARRILERMPGNLAANAVVVEDLMASDPSAAVQHLQGLLSKANSEQARAALEAWLADLEDEAGWHLDAVARWKRRAAAHAASGVPLPPVSRPAGQVPAGDWPAWAGEGGDAAADSGPLFLWGPPGSCVQNAANLLSVLPGFRGERLSQQPPMDGFQRYASVEGLSLGNIDAGQFVDEWREGLRARGIGDERVIEWLAWWDNAFLRVLRAQVPDATVLFVVRDPRDMLMDWLAHGSVSGVALSDPVADAKWMAANLDQVVETVGRPLFRSILLKLDGMENDPARLVERLSDAIGSPLPAAAARKALSKHHLPAGHWRRYADVMADAFATLTPVAVRLGYPAT